MYQIKCDEYILHDSRSNNIRLVEPKCDMELNKTGTLSFRVQPTHPFFDSIKKHKSEIDSDAMAILEMRRKREEEKSATDADKDSEATES